MCIVTYIYTQKMSQTFSWILKFDVKLGVGEHHFWNYTMYVSFQIFGSKLVTFFVFNWISVFIENLKNVFCHWKLKKFWFQTCHSFFVYWIHPFFLFERVRRVGAKRPIRCQFKNLGFSRVKRATIGREAPHATSILKIRGFR